MNQDEYNKKLNEYVKLVLNAMEEDGLVALGAKQRKNNICLPDCSEFGLKQEDVDNSLRKIFYMER